MRRDQTARWYLQGQPEVHEHVYLYGDDAGKKTGTKSTGEQMRAHLAAFTWGDHPKGEEACKAYVEAHRTRLTAVLTEVVKPAAATPKAKGRARDASGKFVKQAAVQAEAQDSSTPDADLVATITAAVLQALKAQA